MLADQQHVHATQSELYEKTIAGLRQELDAARMQLKESKEKAAEPSSLLLHLQQELLSVKVLAAEFSYFVTPSPGQRDMICSVCLSIRLFMHLFICVFYQMCEHDIFKMNALILMEIGARADTMDYRGLDIRDLGHTRLKIDLGAYWRHHS